jgi:2-hydroxychromene-2-carboxylate isomerase
MSRIVDYYLAPISPWTYLGHQRFTDIVESTGATVNVRPVDIGAVFAVSGGLPLAKRPVQRQAYRMVELKRFSKELGMPLNLQPKFFPVPADLAAKIIISVAMHDGQRAAMKMCGAVYSAVWAQERDISNAAVLAELVAECGLPSQHNEQALKDDVKAQFEENTRNAIDAQIFGAPSYVIDGELFWGQDRLEFVRKALATPAAA